MKKMVLLKNNYEPESWVLYCKCVGVPEDTPALIAIEDEKGIRLEAYEG